LPKNDRRVTNKYSICFRRQVPNCWLGEQGPVIMAVDRANALPSALRHGAAPPAILESPCDPRLVALAVSGVAAVIGAMIVTTPVWQADPMAGAIIIAVLGMLAGCDAMLFRRLAAARTQAAAASAAKTRLFGGLAEELRHPLRSIARSGAAIERNAVDPDQWDKIAQMRVNARSALLQLDDILNYLSIEAGSFAPETRSFDLYRLANGAVAALRAQAAERGIVLTLRIDPQLPYQLCGWPHQLRQILVCLITNAIARSGKAKLRIALGTAAIDAGQVTLRLTVTSAVLDAVPADEDEMVAAEDSAVPAPLGLGMADRLARLMGGRISAGADPRRGFALAAELPFAIDQASLALPLDLAQLPALIVTKDAQLVEELIEPLETWRAEPCWIGADDAALGYVEAFEPAGRRPLLIVDGRGDVLQALSWTHHAVSLPAPQPPYVLFVADETRVDSVIGLADGDFDGILGFPFTAATLRGTLHAMRVEPADWFLAEKLPIAPDEPVPAAPIAELVGVPAPEPTMAATVTEITAHPRFAAEAPVPIDRRALDALWSLGDGSVFFRDVIEAFRADSRRAIEKINPAVAAGDTGMFEEGIQALRRCTANFGGGRLRDLLLSLREVNAVELQRQGAAYRERLETELARLDAALVDYLKSAT
jgi:signal transduction histidine kinase